MAVYNIGRVNWHFPNPGTSQTGSYVESGSVEITTSGSTVTVKTTITNNASYSSRDSQYYDKFHIFIGNEEVAVSGDFPSRGSSTQTKSGSRSGISGSVRVEVKMQCGDFTSGCPNGLQSNPANWINIFYQDVTVYMAPSLTMNSITQIGRCGVSTMTGNYTINKGTNDLDWARFDISGGKTIALDRSFGTINKTFTLPGPDSQLNNGTKHTIKVHIDDSYSEYTSNEKTFYTYTEPVIGTNVTLRVGQPQNAITSNSFTISGINNRTWGTNLEQDFQTRYRVKTSTSTDFTGWTNIGNITTWNRTSDQMRSLFPKENDTKENIIQFQRYSPSANWQSTNTAEAKITLYYRPRITIDGNTLIYRKNSSTGTVVSKGQIITNDDALSSIYVSWSFNVNDVEAGYTQGYRVRLYDHSKKLIKTYYTTTKYVNIPKEDIPRLNMTYIDVTPYYTADSTNPDNYWYFTGTTVQYEFVRLVSELEKPTITYPVQDSDWINHEYRVCFQLPVDPDESCVLEPYRYENIEIQINGKVFRITDSAGTISDGILQEDIFSCSTEQMTYRRKLVIYPNLLSQVPNTDTYSIKVRVKKKYGTTSSDLRWSQWSDVRTFTVTIPSYSVKQYDLILAEHYNGGYDTVDRIRNTYGVDWPDKPLRVIKKSTIILADQYSQKTLMKKLNDTKTQVNTYATFDTGRDNLKFDYTDKLPTTFNEKVGEFITADKNEGNEYNGRNYIHYLYDRFLLLK